MRSGQSKLRLTDRKRADILAAAASEFQEHGFDGTSMDRIAEAAQVSKRTVYNHFASKDALFDAIVEQLKECCRQLHLPYCKTRAIDEQLIEIGQAYATLMVSDDFINLSRVVLSRFVQHPQLAGATIRGRGDTQAAIIDWLKAAQKDRRLSFKNAEEAAIQLTALIDAFGFWPRLIGNQAMPSKREINRTVKSAVRLFLAAYSHA